VGVGGDKAWIGLENDEEKYPSDHEDESDTPDDDGEEHRVAEFGRQAWEAAVSGNVFRAVKLLE
jgi:hypothetical protein